MRWTRQASVPPRRQPSSYPASSESGEGNGPVASGCFGGCLGVLASAIAFVVLFTLGSIFILWERPGRESVLAWLGVALGSWALSGLVAYIIAGRLGGSAWSMAIGALLGFGLPVVVWLFVLR